MFGRGTSGEGCDVTSLRLPGVQADLLLALADTGTPVIAVLVTGRPYALGVVAGRLAGIVQAFFPGEEGGRAIAGVLSGRIVPSGKLPVEMPGPDAAPPSSYLRSSLAGPHSGSSVDPSPLFGFGHGLSYTSFGYDDLAVSPDRVPTDGRAEIACTVRNTGSRAGAEVVQLYLGDPVASVARPLRWLAGFVRVPLEPGEARRVRFRVHADQVAFSGRSGRRVIEPGEICVGIGGASDNLPLTGSFTLYGPERVVGVDRVLHTESSIELPSGVPPGSTQHRRWGSNPRPADYESSPPAAPKPRQLPAGAVTGKGQKSAPGRSRRGLSGGVSVPVFTLGGWTRGRQRSGGQRCGSAAGASMTRPPLARCRPRTRSGSSIRSVSRSRAIWPVCSRRRNRLSASSARRSSTGTRLPCLGVRRRG